MSFAKNVGGFVQRPTPEVAYQEQFLAICKAFNYAQIEEIERAIEQFQDMCIPIADEQFMAEIESLNKDLADKYNARVTQYLDSIKGALCPDVVPTPSILGDRSFYRRKQIIIIGLLSRLGLWLTIRKTQVF